MSKLNYPYQFRNGKQLHCPNICLSPSLSTFNHKPLYQPDHIMHTQENTRTNKRDQLACGGISSERLCNGGSLRVSSLFLSFFFVHQLNCKKKTNTKKREEKIKLSIILIYASWLCSSLSSCKLGRDSSVSAILLCIGHGTHAHILTSPCLLPQSTPPTPTKFHHSYSTRIKII